MAPRQRTRRGPHRAGGCGRVNKAGAKLEVAPWAPDLAGPGWEVMRTRLAPTFSELAEGLLVLGCCVGQRRLPQPPAPWRRRARLGCGQKRRPMRCARD